MISNEEIQRVGPSGLRVDVSMARIEVDNVGCGNL
jgi:hypothetical protein